MGDRTGDSFRGWVYALGLCGGWGALGVCCGLCFSTYSLAGGWGVGLLGFGDGGCVLWVCVSGSGMSILGPHIIYVMNVTSLIFLG